MSDVFKYYIVMSLGKTNAYNSAIKANYLIWKKNVIVWLLCVLWVFCVKFFNNRFVLIL